MNIEKPNYPHIEEPFVLEGVAYQVRYSHPDKVGKWEREGYKIYKRIRDNVIMIRPIPEKPKPEAPVAKKAKPSKQEKE